MFRGRKTTSGATPVLRKCEKGVGRVRRQAHWHGRTRCRGRRSTFARPDRFCGRRFWLSKNHKDFVALSVSGAKFGRCSAFAGWILLKVSTLCVLELVPELQLGKVRLRGIAVDVGPPAWRNVLPELLNGAPPGQLSCAI